MLFATVKLSKRWMTVHKTKEDFQKEVGVDKEWIFPAAAQADLLIEIDLFGTPEFSIEVSDDMSKCPIVTVRKHNQLI